MCDAGNIGFDIPEDRGFGACCSDRLWKDLQECTDPFEGLQKGGSPVVRTASFPYPNNVTVETPNGPKLLGDVILSVALWLEVEQGDLSAARKVEYTPRKGLHFNESSFHHNTPARTTGDFLCRCPKMGRILGK
jgi:hypothetical protein